nr:MAG TPA: hypothetical protein [Crassvirales sp.]
MSPFLCVIVTVVVETPFDVDVSDSILPSTIP